MISQENFSKIGFFTDFLESESRLTINNISDKLEPLVFSQAGADIFLKRGSSAFTDGSSGITIFYEVRKPERVARSIFNSMQLLAGSIAKMCRLADEPESFYLTVDFGAVGKQNVTLVDTDPSAIWEGKSVVAVVNLKPECMHDQTCALICFKNRLGKNIPFQTTEPVLDGSRFSVL